MTEDLNCMSFWYPKISKASVPTPLTRQVSTPLDLTSLLDGQTPAPVDDDTFDLFIERLTIAAAKVRPTDVDAFFLRTGHGSGKHDWRNTCFVPNDHVIAAHVASLVEWSHLAHIMGFPTNAWFVRELLPTKPLFHCAAYGGMPVTREFRLFVRDQELEHIQPYWPLGAAAEGQPDLKNWRSLLIEANKIRTPDVTRLHMHAMNAVAAVGGGFWSVDFLQDANGSWWLTDMADGDESFRYDPKDPDA